MKPIIITVRGGVAHVNYSSLPKGVSVEIRDYDDGNTAEAEKMFKGGFSNYAKDSDGCIYQRHG